MITDMKKIQEVAKMLLWQDVVVNETFAFIIHHPFFQTNIYPIKTQDGMRMLNVLDSGECDEARKAVEKQINEATNVLDFMMMINKPYLPAFFKFANFAMSQEDFANFLAQMWVVVEFPNADANISTSQFVGLFKKANKRILMEDADYHFYENLPNVVKIYRGVRNGQKVKALSWTVDFETAKWFANRWDGNGDVYEAEISKKDILAYFSTRNEAEIVVDYLKLKNIKKV